MSDISRDSGKRKVMNKRITAKAETKIKTRDMMRRLLMPPKNRLNMETVKKGTTASNNPLSKKIVVIFFSESGNVLARVKKVGMAIRTTEKNAKTIAIAQILKISIAVSVFRIKTLANKTMPTCIVKSIRVENLVNTKDRAVKDNLRTDLTRGADVWVITF